MKLVLTGDWHLCATTCGVSRRDEIKQAVMQGPVKAAVDGHADLFVFLGDLTDPGSRMAVSDVAFPIEVARALGSVESVWLAGNHDVVLAREPHTTLDALAAARLPGVIVSRGWEYVVRLTRRGQERRPDLLLLPYEAYPTTGGEVTESGLQVSPFVALGHCTTFAGTVRDGSESAEFARGRGMAWPAGTERALFAANGHIHDPQDVELASGATVHLVGSICRLTFGDAERERGFSIVELEVP